MLTRPFNEDPLTPHFYIVKLGFTGVYFLFLFLLKNIDCGYSLEPPTINVLSKNKKNITVLHMQILFFTAVKYHSILRGRVCVMRNTGLLPLSLYNVLLGVDQERDRLISEMHF